MQAEDRPIHFSTELLYAPFPLKDTALRRLYYELSQCPEASYESVALSGKGPPRFYSKRGEQTQSVALFLPDRLVLMEEWVDIPLARFLGKVEEVGRRVLEAFEIGFYRLQTATIRTTFALTHFEDARVFLMDHACRQEGRIGPHFRRPVGVAGLRFVLPATPDLPGDLHIIIESFRRRPNEVFVEAKGIFPEQQIGPASLQTAQENIQILRDFISENISPFLAQYDVPLGEPS